MRIQCKRETAARRRVVAKSLEQREISSPRAARILALADELADAGEGGELSAIIARRERVPEAVVDALINRDRIAQRVRAETMESGIRGAIDEGRRARWQVLTEVA